MGLLVDRRPTALLVPKTEVFIILDTGALSASGCSKPPEIFIKDFIERNSQITRIVELLDISPYALSNKSPAVRIRTVFEDPADAAAVANGMPLAWLDGVTSFTRFLTKGAAVHVLAYVQGSGAPAPQGAVKTNHYLMI